MRGSSADLRELYAATHRRLVVAVAAACGNVDEAEDCVAEAFARALARWDRIARYDDPEAWVRRVALNVARSRWRRLRRQVLGARAEGSTGPVGEDHAALLAALKRLPIAQREAIVLHHLADLSVAEVAIHQGVPVGTVKARLSRGRRSLAKLLSIDDAEVNS